MKKEVLVETSARHVHLSAADIETLFGAGATLTEKKPLSRPELLRAYKAMPASQRLRWQLKRILPRKLIDFAKKTFSSFLRKEEKQKKSTN